MHNPSNRGNGVTQASRRPTGKRAGSIAVVILLGLYAFFQPHLNERFGWNLPGLQDRGNGGQVVETSVDTVGTDKASPTDNAVPPVVARDTQAANRTTESKAASQDVDAARPDHRTSDQGPVSQSHDHADSGSSQSASSAKQSNAVQADELRFGLLREIRDGEFLSPQGLQYVSGSAEGHRLEHLRRHTVDAPSRPGKHGVFDGGMEGALATIDQAYERAKKNQRTTKEIDRDRTIYTVDLGRRVGYVGGSEGKRSRNPMARRVKLVLEGTIFITAYPL